MNAFELGDAEDYVSRPPLPLEPLQWGDDASLEQWREVFMECLGADDDAVLGAGPGVATGRSDRQVSCAEGVGDKGLSCVVQGADPGGLVDAEELELEAQAAFSDGLNTGFYINSYTTKQCPTMEGVLEELRRGLE
eukprot:9384398-Alexandrium_andersonii.AAC.1